MSIAVMNWVWANSPTSGNERLVLLAWPTRARATTAPGAGHQVAELPPLQVELVERDGAADGDENEGNPAADLALRATGVVDIP